MTIDELVDEYLAGKQEGINGGRKGGNLKICQNKLIHYNTTLLERVDDGYILNTSMYSRTSGVLQNKLRNKLKENECKYIEVRGIPKDHDGSIAYKLDGGSN